MFGGLSAGFAYGVGHGFGGGIGDPGTMGRAVAHGVAQGTVSVLRGGKFKSGFAGSFASSVAAPFMRGNNAYVSTAKAAALGGTVSKLVGGKFANGAISAAFVHMFNDLALERQSQINLLRKRAILTKDMPAEVVALLKDKSFTMKYKHSTPEWRTGLSKLLNITARGWADAEANLVYLQSPLWKSNGVIDYKQFVKTFFHEVHHITHRHIQHGAVGSSSYPIFDASYKPSLDAFNSQWGNNGLQ